MLIVGYLPVYSKGEVYVTVILWGMSYYGHEVVIPLCEETPPKRGP